MRDYVVDAKTNNVIESDPNRDWFMKYDMTFNRKKGVLTQAGVSNKSTTNCPNCGAPLTHIGSKNCRYCGTPIVEYNIKVWTFSSVRELR